MRSYEVRGSGSGIEAFYRQILVPSFPPAELVSLDEVQEIADREDASIWLTEDDEGIILGGAVAEWDASVRVLLLSYLAVRPGVRGGGIGGPLYLAALESWRQRFKPCLVLAEIEDPAAPVHGKDHGQDHNEDDGKDHNEEHGAAAARLRFSLNRGSRVLDFPYFQPAL